jgi:transposase
VLESEVGGLCEGGDVAGCSCIAVNRLRCDPRAWAHLTERTGGTEANLDVLRRLERDTAREIYRRLLEAITEAASDLARTA